MEKLIRGRRRAGRELRAGRHGPHGPVLGAHPRTQPAADLRLRQGLQRRLAVDRPQGLRERRAVRRRRRLHHRVLGRPAHRQRRGPRRQQHRHAPADRHPHRADRRATRPAWARRSRCRCRTPCSTCAGSSCATSSAWSGSAIWRSTRSTRTASSATRCRAAATPAAADSPAGCSSAKGGRPTPTPTSTSPSRSRTGSGRVEAIGRPEWIDDPAYDTAKARQTHIFDIFAEIEKWLADKTKYEAVDILRTYEVPCAPVLSMKEIADDPALRARAAASSRSSTRSAAPI